ncbi:MAG: ATP-binding protein [Rhabdochlamydiaceae bacterium]
MTENIFVGRKKELKELNALLNKKTASLVVVKGRRRIGKSRLLEEFGKKKNVIKIVGLPVVDDTTRQKQLDEFARQLSQATHIPEVKVSDWGKLFSLLSSQVKTGRIIVILDEISWMGSEDSDFLGQLKTAWDEQFSKNPKLILILCGSISSWIDDNILNSKAFYGRISWSLNLDPLPLYDCNSLLEKAGFRGSNYEKFKVLSVTGGVPWYLEQIQGDFSADDNIRRQCFTKGGMLVNEFDRIFHEIFGKRDQLYKNIVKALESGPTEYEEIIKISGYESSGRLSEYLVALTKAGFITRDYTWSLKSGRTGKISQFRLSDNYLRFYLKYIESRLDLIEKGRFEKVALSSLSGWESIMGFQFENLVLGNRNSIIKLLGIRLEDILADNPYLQRKTKRKKGCQVDYLIQTKYNNLYLCEIKFSRHPIGSKVIEEVQEKIRRLTLPRGLAVMPVLIHVNGVHETVIESDFFYKIIDFGDLLCNN